MRRRTRQHEPRVTVEVLPGRTHEHRGRVYRAGHRIRVSEDQAEWLVGIGTARRIDDETS